MKTRHITGLFAILILGFLLISGCTQDNNKYCSDNSTGSSYDLSSKMCEKISTETPVALTPTAVRTQTCLPPNHPPLPPTDLRQNKPYRTVTDNSAININGIVHSFVNFSAMVQDPDNDQVKLQVELRQLHENNGNFDETKGGFKESESLASGSYASAFVFGLAEGQYHWQARTIDEHNCTSSWVDYGGNLVSDPDFMVESPPKFLSLPYAESSIQIMNGWTYNYGDPSWDTPLKHQAIDFYLPVNNKKQTFPVVAAAKGKAIHLKLLNPATQDYIKPGYGNYVAILHDEKDSKGDHYITIYAHLAEVNSSIPLQKQPDFSKGLTVDQGVIIGMAGDTGTDKGGGIHLHFELNKGQIGQFKLDPYDIYNKAPEYKPGNLGPNNAWEIDPFGR
jgi:murein DD-endopeptidase MepM/ murein hydrolase activator NlpD